MQPKIALAIAGAALAIPSTALADAGSHSRPPAAGALRASGHLTRDAAAVRHLHARRHRHHQRRHAAHASTASAPLQAIAACESGGNPAANTGNGFYGKYQFTMATWAAVGGRGNPAAASEAEQDRRAAMLYARTGASSWPVCGR